jgi:predicted Zn-dependent peptidase
MYLHRAFVTTIAALALASAALTASAQEVKAETYTLPNGLTVILHEDHRLPQVTINTWFAVGSKDEAPGRSGFAHLFEHLMFMGTARVPTGQFDEIMESGGGSNNASTATDRTNYFSEGPSSLLPTLLWLDADRLEGLGKAMTQEKLDLQRSVVLNERRQNTENVPYGVAELLIPDALYPADHPYHHPVIGSPEDLQAAKLQDVKDFFATYYVPGNASLVVAGDFDSMAAKELVAKTFGAVPAQPAPSHRAVPVPVLDREVRRLATDKVKYPKLILVWHSPPEFDAGDAEMELAAAILADGTSGRLHKRLVLDEQIAQEVDAYQNSQELVSEFTVEATAASGVDLERLKKEIIEEMERFKAGGPSDAEMKRVKAAAESRFLRRMESLGNRADMLNMYQHFFGYPDGFKRDLARYTGATAQGLRDWARKVWGDGRLDLRIIPADAAVDGANLDKRPGDLPQGKASVPVAEKLALANGVPLYVVSRPGTGLFAGALVVDGGERLVPSDKAGLASLVAELLTKGAGGKDASSFADAVTSLGASISASATWHGTQVEVRGLSSRMAPTLDLFADVIMRPNLTEKDFQRERELALQAIASRQENPRAVASIVTRALTFGKDDPRGRADEGYAKTVGGLTPADARALLPRLLDPAGASLVFAGDFDPSALKAELDKRLSGWKPSGEKVPPLPSPIAGPAAGRIVVVDRPGAPQTVISLSRPIGAPQENLEAARDTLDTLFGGSFTSRLNQNLREKHGYTYGARGGMNREANQVTLFAGASVQTAVTAAALTEFKREFDGLAKGGATAEEVDKARRTMRFYLLTQGETTGQLAGSVAALVADGRPLDAYQREVEALDGVNIEAVNAQAHSGAYAWDGLLIVLVGDKAAILPQLEKAGFPKPVFADAEGNIQHETKQ